MCWNKFAEPWLFEIQFMLTFVPVLEEDFDAMFALRMDALRASLERLGRFDPVAGLLRFRAGFDPLFMQHICSDGASIGFVTMRPAPGAQYLQHLFIQAGQQNIGVGAWVLDWVKGQARAIGQDVTVSTLKLSPANRFYLRHGFVQTGESEFDNDYRWTCEAQA
jgi:GNAT superfamily N-acetyltransferase